MTPGRNRSVETFADRATSKLYLDPASAKPLSPIEAFAEATKNRLAVRRVWVERLEAIADEAFRMILDRVPAARITTAAADFAYALMRVNKARILLLD